MADRYGPHKSLAIVAAIASFMVHSGIAGLTLAIVAVVLGLIGFLSALLPGTSGGILSVLAMGLGLIGAVCGIIRAIIHFLGHL